MARKRILPYEFPLSSTDWAEVYNCLDPEDGAGRKLPQDGEGMTDAKRQRRLSERDWIEIYLAVQDKRDALKTGFYGRDTLAREWRHQMESILETLAPVAETFIGKAN